MHWAAVILGQRSRDGEIQLCHFTWTSAALSVRTTISRNHESCLKRRLCLPSFRQHSKTAFRLLRSIAHDLENALNPDQRRATAVRVWLESLGAATRTTPEVAERTRILTSLGIRGFDAFHLAWAEALHADAIVTTDDKFIRKAQRLGAKINVRIVEPVTIAAELTQ